MLTGELVLCLQYFCCPFDCRLGGFLLIRELKGVAYNSLMKTKIKDGGTVDFGVKCGIRITCTALYGFQVFPFLPPYQRKGDWRVDLRRYIFSGVSQWVMVPMGHLVIVHATFSGARRLEARQNKNYSKDPEYQAYKKTRSNFSAAYPTNLFIKKQYENSPKVLNWFSKNGQ